MKFIIVFSDGTTESVEVEDHIDGEMYGNSGPVDVKRVSLARSESV